MIISCISKKSCLNLPEPMWKKCVTRGCPSLSMGPWTRENDNRGKTDESNFEAGGWQGGKKGSSFKKNNKHSRHKHRIFKRVLRSWERGAVFSWSSKKWEHACLCRFTSPDLNEGITHGNHKFWGWVAVGSLSNADECCSTTQFLNLLETSEMFLFPLYLICKV